MNSDDVYFMEKAISLALRAKEQGEVPIGALVLLDNEIIGEGYNCPISTNDPTAHAEIKALREAAQKIKNYRLVNTTLYVTLKPCMMCWGAINHARVSRVVFGATDLKENNYNIITYGGILEEKCGEILKQFFKERR